MGIDTGLHSLLAIAKIHLLPADPEQLLHEFAEPGKPFADEQILRSARALGFRSRVVRVSPDELDNALLPAIARYRDEPEYFLLARASEQADGTGMSPGRRYLVHDLREPSPRVLGEEELAACWSGEAILLTLRRGWASGLKKRFDISWFIPSFVKYRKLLGEVLLASFVLQLFALATPLFFQVVMDKVLAHRGFTTLDVLAIGFLGVVIFEALIGGFRNYLFSHTSHRVDVELGSRLFRHLLNLPLAYFQSRQVGQSVARVRELDRIREFITGSAMTLVIDLFFVFVFFGVMWYYSPSLTGIVLAALPAYVLLSVLITPSLRRRLEDKFQHAAANTAFLTETIHGIGTVKTLAVEPSMRRRLDDHLSRYVEASFRSQNLGNIAGQIAGLINRLMTLGIIWWGAHLVIDGQISVGQLVAFNMLAGRVSGPILKLVQLWQDFQQAGISIERLGDILNTPEEPGFNPSRTALPALRGDIRFDRVDFRYRVDGPLVLQQIDLKVKAGEVIGIVGRSGSGKSTLSHLLQRLFVPESGRIQIDGIDLSVIDTAWLRRQTGVVLQESFLFNQSIRENIAIADLSLPMKTVIEAARLAGAHDFISELAEGYDTLVGEQGCNLSGGQRQRLAIARALVLDPRILIFDEATSALDYESEEIIRRNMARICKGRTVFIIAHRLTAVRDCDRILVMEQGRIVEQGNHQELLKQQGRYARLYRYQQQAATEPTANAATHVYGSQPAGTRFHVTRSRDGRPKRGPGT